MKIVVTCALALFVALCSACSSRDGGGPSGANGGFVNANGGVGAGDAGGSTAATMGGAMIVFPSGTAGKAGGSASDECIDDCNPVGGQWCGEIGDNCGAKLQCPVCSGDWTCKEGLCVGGPSCERKSCQVGELRYCGKVGDGCGAALDCGDCPDGGTCGGGGIEHLCKPANCTPLACVDAKSGGQYCGDIGDGCGGLLHCGECKDGKVCGSDGTPNVCPGQKCTNLQCTIQNDACPEDAQTTLTGTVYDPAGRLPLYNALVYVPNDPLPLADVPDGASCEKCAATAVGSPITTALTDVNGTFTLKNVPSGANVPLVIQVGRWRRVVTLDTTINKCANNAVTNKDLTRLPRNKMEGHIPRIALTTGPQDALECLLRRIGIDDSEFTTDMGNGRVHLYAGLEGYVGPMEPTGQGATQFDATLGGGTFSDATTLWADAAKLQGYDILLMSCEGNLNRAGKRPYLDNMLGYMNAGGRVFVDHLHFTWLMDGAAELRGTASYEGDVGDLKSPSTVLVDTSFPKGAALADWLVLTGASTTRGQITIYGGQESVSSVNAPTERWIYQETSTRMGMEVPDPWVQYLAFNTPVTAVPDKQCGRVVYTDIHISTEVTDPSSGAVTGGDTSRAAIPFPGGCTMNDMSPQAKALEFLFFDLSSCVVPGDVPPAIPPPPNTPPPPVAVPPPPPPPPPPPR